MFIFVITYLIRLQIFNFIKLYNFESYNTVYKKLIFFIVKTGYAHHLYHHSLDLLIYLPLYITSYSSTIDKAYYLYCTFCIITTIIFVNQQNSFTHNFMIVNNYSKSFIVYIMLKGKKAS